MPGILAQDASGGRRGHAPARRRPTRDARMSRHGGPGAPRAAERLPGLRALRALLRRVLGRAGPDPHRLLAHPRSRRDPPLRHRPLAPGHRWRLLDGDTELMPGVTALRTDGHTPGHQSLLVELPETGPVILAADSCYWQEHIDKERVPGVVWNPTQALHSIKKLKTIARLTGARIFPGHDPNFWETVRQSPDAYR